MFTPLVDYLSNAPEYRTRFLHGLGSRDVMHGLDLLNHRPLRRCAWFCLFKREISLPNKATLVLGETRMHTILLG